MSSQILAGAFVPGLPHILHPGKSPAWKRLHDANQKLGKHIQEMEPEVLVIYSSQWLSVLGTSFQVHPNPKGTHIDENWYDLGDLTYDFESNVELGEKFSHAVKERGFPTKTVAYDDFPIDTGTIVALKLLNPNALPVCVVSSWAYADAKASFDIGQSMRAVCEKAEVKAVFIASSLLSARYFTRDIEPAADRISHEEDDKWNKKILNRFEGGDFKAVAKLAPEFMKEVPADMQFNAFHWLSGALDGVEVSGEVLAYGPLWGTGAAVVEFPAKEWRVK